MSEFIAPDLSSIGIEVGALGAGVDIGKVEEFHESPQYAKAAKRAHPT